MPPCGPRLVADQWTFAVNAGATYIHGMGDNPLKADDRGAKPGNEGNRPHVRDEEAAILIRAMAGYGMPREEISHALNAAKGGGFSVDTLDRHYRPELDQALAERKAQLLTRAHKIALGEDIPDGVSKDEAYRTGARQLNWLLGAVHRVRTGVEHDFGAGTINVNISPDDAEL